MHFWKKFEKMKDPDGPTDVVPFYKLFKFSDSLDIFLLIMGATAAVANGVSRPLMMSLFGDLIDSFGDTADRNFVVHEVSQVVLDFVYLGLGAAITSFLQVTLLTVTSVRQVSRIRNLYLKSVLNQEIAFFDKNNVETVVGNISCDMVLIQDAIGEKIGKFVQLVSLFLGGFAVAFSNGWLLALVMLPVIPLLILSTSFMSTVISKMTSRGQKAYSEAAIIAEQSISSIRTVASFTMERHVQSRYDMSLKTGCKASTHEGLAAGMGLGSVYFIVFFGYAVGVWFGTRMILNNGYKVGHIISVIFALLTGSFSLGEASPCISAFAAGRVAASKLFMTIDRKPEINTYSAEGNKLDDIVGDIEFKDVYFSYPVRPEEQAGEILIDGVNLKQFQLRWIRGKIGLVSQEPILFSGSIRDNIAYGKDDATEKEINAAAELANALKFIENMPQGLDTMVGEHGIQLSGGQKQRIAIARAILKNPRILLLDEATSALDVESEKIVQDALGVVMATRTTVLVAHRLSTVKNADTIAVLHKGSIVEKGSHSQLLCNPNGAYHRLICQQKINQDPGLLLTEQNSGQLEELHCSQHSSFRRSISRGSSVDDSKISVSFGFPLQIATQESVIQDLENGVPLQQSQKVYIQRLAYLNKPELLVMLVGVVAAVINGIILPIFGMLLSSVIHTFFEPKKMLSKHSAFWSLMFIVLGSVSLVTIPAKSYCFAVAGSNLIKRIRSMTFSKVVHMEIGWFDDPQNTSGVVGARLSGDAAAVRSLVGDTLALIVQNVATLVAGLVIAFTSCWQLALIMFALVPLIGVNGWIQMKYMKGFNAKEKAMFKEAGQIAYDAVTNIRTVASFTAEDKVMKIYEEKCVPVKLGIRQGLINGSGYGLSFLLVFCAYALSFYSGARLIRQGETQFTNVFCVFFVLNLVAVGISQSSSLIPDATKAGSAAASIFALLDRESKINSAYDMGEKLQEVCGSIEFQHVSFHYSTRPDVQIFEDFCLAIEPGKTVALVGESGSGKSTVISLLQRFYEPHSGKVLLDGVEIQKLQIRWLRQQMGLVSQEPTLFNYTIRENIACGKPNPNPAPSPNPMQSWWESISRARSRIESLAAVLPPSSSAAALDTASESDRPARALLDSHGAYAAVSASLSRPSAGSGDDPLCQWLYETYQSSDPDLRLVVLSFVPLLAGLYLSRVVAAHSSSAAPSLAGFEAVLLSLYSAETKARGGKPLLIHVPDLSQPSLYYSPRVGGGASSSGGRMSQGSAAAQAQPTVGILSPPLEPQIAVKSTKRACIVAVALDCYFKKISFMPSPSKVDLCEFAAAWAGQYCSCRYELDQLDDSSFSFSGASFSEARAPSDDEDGNGSCARDMSRLGIEERQGSCDPKGEVIRSSRGSRVPFPWELQQPVLRILGHCLLAPLNSQEVRDAASSAVRCVYARASHDLVPQAILASRSLIQLDKRARDEAAKAAATASSNPNTPSKPKKPEILLASK